MAETADILVNRPEQIVDRGGNRVDVVLPDTAAAGSVFGAGAHKVVNTTVVGNTGEITDGSAAVDFTAINIVVFL